MRLAGKWHHKAQLVIIGDDLENGGAYRRKMEQLAGQLDCPVTFYGFQKNVRQWLEACDVVMVPSHAEPLGNATLEAMASGRPVIGCRVGGIPEMIDHQETGLLVSPKSPEQLAEAIDFLLSHDQQRTEWGQEARRRCADRFSLAAHINAVVHQYREVPALASWESRHEAAASQ
jgi:glycosyltransferase involved in cell wall biosynthesis